MIIEIYRAKYVRLELNYNQRSNFNFGINQILIIFTKIAEIKELMIVIIIFLIIFIIVDLIFILKKETNNRILFCINLAVFGVIVYLNYVNKYLWQISFLLLLALILLILSINKIKKFYPKVIYLQGKIILINFSLIAFLLTIIAFLFFPIPILPKPSGDYLVGTREYIIGPNVCQDNIYMTVNGPLNKPKSYKLVIKIWYPSELGKTKDRYAISEEEIVRIIKFSQV